MYPYSKNLKPIDDIMPYFEMKSDGSVIFTGETLELRIPRKFEKHGSLIISDVVTTLGSFDMIINDEYHAAMNILNLITITPSDIGYKTIGSVEYVLLYLVHGQTFIANTKVIQDSHVVYVLWTEYVTNGGWPYWMTYASALKLFEHVKELTGGGIGVSRSVFEGIITQMARDQDNIQTPYRLTDMAKPMKMVALKSISQATSGTVSKINGSYFSDDGLTSALRYQVDQNQPFEDILRGLPNHLKNNHPNPDIPDF